MCLSTDNNTRPPLACGEMMYHHDHVISLQMWIYYLRFVFLIWELLNGITPY